MAVYTIVERDALTAFLRRYDVGTLVNYRGIESGIENTNYFVTTTGGEFVLTLFEVTDAGELAFFLAFMRHCVSRGVPCPAPVADRDGAVLGRLCNRPAALVSRLDGASVDQPSAAQCAAVGRALARMHSASLAFNAGRDADRGSAWRVRTGAQIDDLLSTDQRQLMVSFAALKDLEPGPDLPGGVVHADLFRDNVLFDGDALSGVIDFYYAHSATFIYDLAVTFADWCFIPQVGLSLPCARALLTAYTADRALGDGEREHWIAALELAAARFWISRTRDLVQPRGATLTVTKDPAPFAALYRATRADPARLSLDTLLGPRA